MNLIEDFLDGKIGLDALKSRDEDVKILSDIIENEFHGRIVPQSGFDAYSVDSRKLYSYWKTASNGGWEIIFIHADNTYNMKGVLDAYENEGARRYAETHPLKTAAEILDSITTINIQEDDLMSLFE